MNPILYDLTHLSHRAEVAAPSGIDRVDLMFARAFARSPRLAGAVHYGVRRPSVLTSAELAHVVARAERRWRAAAGADPGFAALRGFLSGAATAPAVAAPRPIAGWRRELTRRARIGRFKLISQREAPQGAVYLNIAQHALERRSHFDWLNGRPDIKPVFFLHDLLPLDYPEFWPAGHKAIFERRIATLFERARGVVMSSETVAQRVRQEFARRGLAAPALFAAPLPSPLQDEAAAADDALATQPYFVTLGSIEPRKNHLALLNLWRAMVESGTPAPKLVVVGGRGWLNAETCAVLDRARALKGLVVEASGLGDQALRTLIGNARALLAPSLAEGYGLPVVEALALGVPVIASDLPIFREVCQGCATLIAPHDGAAWGAAVLALCDAASARARQARAQAMRFRGPDAASYFNDLEAFLQSL